MKTLNERLNEYFTLGEKYKADYDMIKEKFIDINLDLFINKVYPNLYENVEDMTFLGMVYENEQFMFYYLMYDNKMIVMKTLQGETIKEDYKRYQEQLMELGRS